MTNTELPLKNQVSTPTHFPALAVPTFLVSKASPIPPSEKTLICSVNSFKGWPVVVVDPVFLSPPEEAISKCLFESVSLKLAKALQEKSISLPLSTAPPALAAV
jgi:hypothetical protein